MKYYSVLFLLGLFFQFASDIQGRILLLCQNMSCVLVRIHVKSVYCLCVCIFVVHGCMSLCEFGECAGFFFCTRFKLLLSRRYSIYSYKSSSAHVMDYHLNVG